MGKCHCVKKHCIEAETEFLGKFSVLEDNPTVVGRIIHYQDFQEVPPPDVPPGSACVGEGTDYKGGVGGREINETQFPGKLN